MQESGASRRTKVGDPKERMKAHQPRDSRRRGFGSEEVGEKERMFGAGEDAEEIADHHKLRGREIANQEKAGFAMDLAESADRGWRKTRNFGCVFFFRKRNQHIEKIAGDLVGEGVLVDL